MDAHRAGLLASLRRLLSTALEIVQTRLELLGNELEQEKLNLFEALWWGALALLLMLVSLVLAIGAVMFVLQAPYRAPALGVFALVGLGAGVAMWRHARRRLQSLGGAFGASVRELARDRAELASGE